jgi:hypothetical protein
LGRALNIAHAFRAKSFSSRSNVCMARDPFKFITPTLSGLEIFHPPGFKGKCQMRTVDRGPFGGIILLSSQIILSGEAKNLRFCLFWALNQKEL